MEIDGVDVGGWERRVGAPELNGTPRQVGWARGIRASMVGGISRSLKQAQAAFRDPDDARWASGRADRVVRLLLSRRSASWWIAHRDDNPLDVADAAMRELDRLG